MAAPEQTVWGNTITGSKSTYKGKLGIYKTKSSSYTQVTFTIQVWFKSMYGIEDVNNSYYYDEAASATTYKAKLSINHPISTGSGWDTRNETLIATYTHTYNRGSTSVNKYFSAKLTGIDNLGANNAMTVSVSDTVEAKDSYTITYNANGGSGAPSSQIKWHGESIRLSSTEPTRTGYKFAGWGTSSTDATVDYPTYGLYEANASITLYAIWTANGYSVSYNANGGTGAPSTQTQYHDTTLTLSNVIPVRENYNFKGWATSASASTATYQPGSAYMANAPITLYAIWELAYTRPRITSLSVDRCDSNGVLNDSGTYGVIEFNWACDLNGVSIIIESKQTILNVWTTEYSVSNAESSGSVTMVIGNGVLDADSTYDIQVKVSDGNGETVRLAILTGTKFPIDVYAEGKGIAFGKAAELDGYLESKFKAMFYDLVEFKGKVEMASDMTIQGGIQAGGGVRYVIPVMSGDLNTILTSGNYYMGNDSTNRPENANGWLEVKCYGEGNYCYQLYITYTGKKYERFKTDGTWGSWKSI